MQLFVSFITGVVLFHTFLYFPFLTGCLTLLCSFIFVLKKKLPIMLFLLSGIAFAFLRQEPVKDLTFIRDNIHLQGVIQSYPTKTNSGMFKQHLLIDSASNIKTCEILHDLTGKKIILLSDRDFYPGSACEINARFIKKKIRLNPSSRINNDQFAVLLDLYSEKPGRTTAISVIQNQRYKLDRFITANFKKDSGDFLKAITLGQKAGTDYELIDAFNKAGLAHILSISGTHFGLFSMFLFGFFRLIIKRLPYRILQRITLFLTPSQAAAMLCLPFMLAYLCLSGASTPAVRSFIIIVLFMIGLIVGRKDFWLTSLSFAAWVLVLCTPDMIFGLSFQLSFIAVLFIGFSIPHAGHEKRTHKKILIYFKNILLITLSASIGTAPLVAYHFHYFSLISPVSNLLIAPLVGFILIPLSVVSAFLFLATGHFIFTPVVSALSDMIISLVKFTADIHLSHVKIPSFPLIILLLFYAGFIFYILLQKRKSMLIIPFIPILIYVLFSVFEKNDFSITYLDVGQGDSSVIELPDGKTIVIDTGRTGRETGYFLNHRGKGVISALVLSHIHPDHTGGLQYLARRFKVKEIWHNGRMIIPEAFTRIKQRSLSRGDLVEGAGYHIYVLHPYPEFYTLYGNEYISENNDSLLLQVIVHRKSFLFTGDIEEEAQEDIFHLAHWLKSDVLKVPHHGGKTSLYGPFIEEVSPDFAVISVGRNNPFGHPHYMTLHAYRRARIFRTDIDGAVKIQNSTDGLTFKTGREFQFKNARSLTDEIKNIKRLFETW